jgi:hypothetical protein
VEIDDDGFDDFGRRVGKTNRADRQVKEEAALKRLQEKYKHLAVPESSGDRDGGGRDREEERDGDEDGGKDRSSGKDRGGDRGRDRERERDGDRDGGRRDRSSGKDRGGDRGRDR